MNKIIILLLVTIAFSTNAQNSYETVLTEIENNSIALKALHEQMEAQKMGTPQNTYISNPEVEFGYLWGSPSELGNRLTVNIKQSFDFPSAYKYRRNIANTKNISAEWQYKAERMNLLLTAKQICAELTYCNALLEEYNSRLKNAEKIAESYRIKLQKGEANILESNKAELNLANVQNEVSRIKIEQNSLLTQLKQLNGGKEITFINNEYPTYVLPNSFDNWYTEVENKNPLLQYVKAQVEISHTQAKLQKTESLPKFSVGYIGEFAEDKFQGVSAGFSIPLWENKNQAKSARAMARAAEISFEDSKLQFYYKLQNLYAKADNLHKNTLKSREALTKYGNEIHLKKALDLGEISLLEYLLEVEYYYDAINNLLETEKQLQLSLIELSAVEL